MPGWAQLHSPAAFAVQGRWDVSISGLKISVVDRFDSLAMQRHSRRPFSHSRTLDKLVRG